MTTIPINFVDYGARCNALSRNSIVNCAVCSGRDYDQDEIISNSRPTCFAQDEISSSWLSQTDIIDKDNHHGETWSWFFSSIISFPLGHGSSREIWPLERSASELMPRVMVLLAGNHFDLLDRGTYHVSLIHLFVSFQMSGPIAYK